MQRLATLIGFLIVVLGVSTTDAQVDRIESYGVYVKSKDGYMRPQQISEWRQLNFDPTARMFDFPIIHRGNQKLELVIYYPSFHPGPFQLEARPIESPGKRKPLKTRITPEQGDRYVVETKSEVPDDHLVMINLSCCVEGVYGLALQDPKSVIMDTYAKGSDANPVTVEQHLSTIVEALPDDDDIAKLHEYWQKRVAQEEATEHFQFIKNVWEKYESAESADKRIEHLKHIKSITKDYLEGHPQGRERDQVKEMLEKAKSKLDI